MQDEIIIDIENPKKDDLISRQAVINSIANTNFWLSAENWQELMKAIDSVPSVQPEQRWIPIAEKWPEKDGRYWVTVEFKHKDGSNDYQTNIATLELGTFLVLEDLFIGEQKRIVAWMPHTEPEPWKGEE